MIDYLAIGLTHLLLAVAMLRLLSRGDLDREPKSEPTLTPPILETAPSPADAPRHGGVARLPGLGRPRGGPRA